MKMMMKPHGENRPVLAAWITSTTLMKISNNPRGMAIPARCASSSQFVGERRGAVQLYNRKWNLPRRGRSGCLAEVIDHAREQPAPVGHADGGFHVVLGMRHHAQHIAALADDAGDGIDGAVVVKSVD